MSFSGQGVPSIRYGMLRHSFVMAFFYFTRREAETNQLTTEVKKVQERAVLATGVTLRIENIVERIQAIEDSEKESFSAPNKKIKKTAGCKV